MKKTKKLNIFRLIFLIIIFLIIMGCISYGCKLVKKTKIDSYIESLTKDKKFSGTVLVAKNGKIILNKGYGMANYEFNIKNDKDTKFKIGGLTEQFTAAAILQLQDKGMLSLDDKVSKYLPKYPGGDNITIYHLLTHTSGIPDYASFEDYENIMTSEYTVQNIIDDFKNKPLQFKPGTKYKFSNSGYVLLGAIIEKVSGKSYADYLSENIFKPLKMNDTAYFDEKTVVKNKASGYAISEEEDIVNAPYCNSSHEFSAGGIISTVEDLYLWDRALYTEDILSNKAKDSMFALSKDQKYAFGWLSDVNLSKEVVWQNGVSSGFTNNITRYYKDDCVIIILSNKSFNTSDIEKMSSDIALYLFQ